MPLDSFSEGDETPGPPDEPAPELPPRSRSAPPSKARLFAIFVFVWVVSIEFLQKAGYA